VRVPVAQNDIVLDEVYILVVDLDIEGDPDELTVNVAVPGVIVAVGYAEFEIDIDAFAEGVGIFTGTADILIDGESLILAKAERLTLILPVALLLFELDEELDTDLSDVGLRLELVDSDSKDDILMLDDTEGDNDDNIDGE
jgi:hypothetical protein